MYGDGFTSRSARYSDSPSTSVSAVNFCDGTTWMHSPSAIASLHFATIPAYSSRLISGAKSPTFFFGPAPAGCASFHRAIDSALSSRPYTSSIRARAFSHAPSSFGSATATTVTVCRTSSNTSTVSVSMNAPCGVPGSSFSPTFGSNPFTAS